MTDPSPAPASAPAASPAAPAPGRRGLGLATLVLALVAAGVFLQTLGYDLAYDDAFVIRNNASMRAVDQDVSAAFKLFGQEYWEGINPDSPELLKVQGQALYRPLSLFLWACIRTVLGPGVTWGYHLLNILLHVGVVLLLHRVALLLFDNRRLAFLGALLFAVHPLHSEGVAYVAGVHDVIGTAGVLAGLLFFLRGRDGEGTLSTGALLGILVSMFIALLSKESAVLLIPVLMLTDVMQSQRGHGLKGGQRVILYAGLALTFALHMVIRYQAVGYLAPQPGAISAMDNPLIDQPFDVRLFTGLKLLAMQVWLVLWPAVLSSDYSFDAIPVARSFLEPEVLSGFVLIVAMGVMGLLWFRCWPALAWGILVFLGCSLMTANILMPIGTIFAERLMYLPTVGACLALAAVLDRLLLARATDAAGHVHPVALLVMVAIVGGLTIRTIGRNGEFQHSLALFEAAVEAVPNSARAHFQLGALNARAELYGKAEYDLRQAMKIMERRDGGFVIAQIELGDMFRRDKNWDQAIVEYDSALRTLDNKRSTESHPTVVEETKRMLLGRLAMVREQMGDLGGAEAELRRMIQMQPERHEGYIGLGQTLVDQQRYAEAVPILDQALALVPQNPRALDLLARAAAPIGDFAAFERAMEGRKQTESGRPRALCVEGERMYAEARLAGDMAGVQAAMAKFEEARRLDDTLATPHLYRGRFLAEDGRLFEALSEFNRAIEREPRHPVALLSKARVLLIIGDEDSLAEAVTTLGVLEGVYGGVDCYTLLAEAYFKMGDLKKVEGALRRLKQLGTVPVEVIMNHAFALEDDGQIDEALDVLDDALTLEDHGSDADLHRERARLLLKAGRHAEALVALDRQAVAEVAEVDLPPDRFLPVNRAKALMGLGRDVEAAQQLEVFEAAMNPGDRLARSSLLRWRAELFLRPSGAFYDPAAAQALAEEGLLITDGAPPFYDLSIEARLAQDQVEAALARAVEAAADLPQLPRFGVAGDALALAAAGDVGGAATLLREGDEPMLMRLADALER